MGRFTHVIDRISNVFGIIAGVFVTIAAGMVITEIIVRTFFNSTIYITTEYTAYFMVAITFLGLALTLKDKEHIRMVFLHKWIKHGKPRFVLELYSYIVGLIVFILVTVASTNLVWESLMMKTQSMQLTRTYLAIPQLSMVLGSLLIALQFIAEIGKILIRMRKGEVSKEDIESQALGR